MHYFYVEDASGDLIDLVPFCSDYCHRHWCEENNKEYQGWNGCQERADYTQYCEWCETKI